MKNLTLAVAASVALLCPAWADPLPDVDLIRLQAVPTKGHLQDVWHDGGGHLFWSNGGELFKTDLKGRVMRRAEVGGHHGGLAVRDGRVYVAVCGYGEPLNNQTMNEVHLMIGEYDAETLDLVKVHVLKDVHDQAGALAIGRDGMFYVGCLRPLDIRPDQLRFHRISRDFRHISSHVVEGVPALLGIETMRFVGDELHLFVYDLDSKRAPLGYDTIRLNADLKVVGRTRTPFASCGLVSDGSQAWTGRAEACFDRKLGKRVAVSSLRRIRARELELVRGSRSRFSVLCGVDASPSVRFAAEELVKWTKELTGADVEIGEKPIAGLIPLSFAHLAPDEAEVRGEGFRIEAGESGVVIRGNSPGTPLFAVYYLLNRFGGIDWFAPDSGADFVRTDRFAIPSGNWSKNPMLKRQGTIGGNGPWTTAETREQVALWNARNGFMLNEYEPIGDPEKVRPGNHYANGTILKCGHDATVACDASVGDLILETPVDADELKREIEAVRRQERGKFKSGRTIPLYAKWKILCRRHPEWFGLVGGRRVPCGVALREGSDYIGGPSSMPCLSNPALREAILANVRRRRDAAPAGRPYYAKVICDDQSQWCECEACLKLLNGKGKEPKTDKASDYWWDYANWFSGELLKDPKAWVKVYVYGDYQDYPRRIRPVPRDRMSIRLCPHGRCYLHPLEDAACPMNGRFRRMFEQWMALGMPVVTFEYMCELPGASNYAPWERSWIRDLKWYAKNGISTAAGMFFGPWTGYSTLDDYMWDHEAKSRWLHAYLSAHFEWDPDDDFETVRSRALAKYYRAAAKPMAEYRRLLETAFYGTGKCMSDDKSFWIFQKAAQPETLIRANALLEEAYALAAGDRELLRRLARDKTYFHFNWERASMPPQKSRADIIERTSARIVADGRLDEEAWMRAVPTDLTRDVRVRALYDSRNLYLAVERAAGGVEERTIALHELKSSGEGDTVCIPISGAPEAVFTLGRPKNLLANGSFETVAPPPHGPLDGMNWEFASAQVPSGWFYQQDGGIAESVTGSAARGERFLRLRTKQKQPCLHLLQSVGAYPADTDRMRVTLRVRGKTKVSVLLTTDGGPVAADAIAVDGGEWRKIDWTLSLKGSLRKVMFTFTGEAEIDDAVVTPLAPDLALVVDGKAKFSVVLPDSASPSDRLAVRELVHWIAELTGAAVAAGPEAAAGTIPLVFRHLQPDETDSGVSFDGFRVDAFPLGVTVSAKDPRGILFAVYYLLNRFGGIDWFAPDTGADFTKTDRLSIPTGTLIKTPMAIRRGVPPGSGKGTTPEMRRACAFWNVRNGFPLVTDRPGEDPDARKPGNEYDNRTIRELGWSPYTIGGPGLGMMLLEMPVDEKELKREIEEVRKNECAKFKTGSAIPLYARWKVLARHHPEWFPLVGGRRVPCGVGLREGFDYIGGPTANPCISHPSARAAFVEAIRRWRDRTCPGERYLYKLLCDDQQTWCECELCRRLLAETGRADKPGKASDLWWDFVNAVVPEILKDPLAECAVYAYRNYQDFPTRIKPVSHERMMIRYCPHGRCYLHPLVDVNCPVNTRFREGFAEWAAAGFPVATFEYFGQLPGACNYAFWERSWVEDLKWYAAHNVSHTAGMLTGPWNGFSSQDTYFWHESAKARWLHAYLSGRFEWDPQDDFEDVRDEKLRKYFRAAAKPMAEYHDLLERALYRTGLHMDYGADGGVFAVIAAERGTMDRARELLAEAERLAAGDGRLKMRIAREREYFHTNLESSEIADREGAAFAIPHVAVEPTEKEWAKIPAMTDFRSLGGAGVDTPARSSVPPNLPASLRLAWTDEALFLHFTCATTNGIMKDVPDDGSRFAALTGTHVEFFLMSAAQKGWYFHNGVAHSGRAYSALTAGGRKQDFSKSLDFTYRVRDGQDYWTVDIAVPLSGMGGAKAGDVWKIDACSCAPSVMGKPGLDYDSLCGWGCHLTEYWPMIIFSADKNSAGTDP